jgi:hypothetical protein
MRLAGSRSSCQKSCTSYSSGTSTINSKLTTWISISLTKLESLIFVDTLNTANSNFNLEDLINEQTSYSNGRNFLEWIRATEPPYTHEPVVDSMIQWWYRLEGTFKTRIAFPVWFRPFRPSDAPRLSEQFVTPRSGMVTQVQQLTRGRSASESSAGSTVCRSTQVMQGNEILAPTMASMRLQNPTNNVNSVGGFGRIGRVNFTFVMNFADKTSFSSAIITIRLDFLGLRSTIILKGCI